MFKNKKDIGNKGEEVALSFLLSKNFQILYTNFKRGGGEIDIIAKKNNNYHFVEVKTRIIKKGEFIIPEEAVDYLKRKRMKKVIDKFFYENNLNQFETGGQVDVISILLNLDTEKASLKYYPRIRME